MNHRAFSTRACAKNALVNDGDCDSHSKRCVRPWNHFSCAKLVHHWKQASARESARRRERSVLSYSTKRSNLTQKNSNFIRRLNYTNKSNFIENRTVSQKDWFPQKSDFSSIFEFNVPHTNCPPRFSKWLLKLCIVYLFHASVQFSATTNWSRFSCCKQIEEKYAGCF